MPTVRWSTIDLGHLVLIFCWAVESCWTQPPKHLLRADTKEETSSNCPSDSQNRGPFRILWARDKFPRAAT